MWIQKNITIGKKEKGFHLITDQLINHIPEINEIYIGLLNVFILHTSASITLNENMDSSVRDDFESFFNRLVPENQNYFTHTNEGSDDMPAHLKTLLTQTNLTLSIKNKKLILGNWQGIFLLEHRDLGRTRDIIFHYIGD